MSVIEVFLRIENRTVSADLENNSLQGLKDEFNELCEEDDALKARRKTHVPTFSLFNKLLNTNVEVKRRQTFVSGDTIFIGWAPLKPQGEKTSATPLSETESDQSLPKGHRDSAAKPTCLPVAGRAQEGKTAAEIAMQQVPTKLAALGKEPSSQKKCPSSSTIEGETTLIQDQTRREKIAAEIAMQQATIKFGFLERKNSSMEIDQSKSSTAGASKILQISDYSESEVRQSGKENVSTSTISSTPTSRQLLPRRAKLDTNVKKKTELGPDLIKKSTQQKVLSSSKKLTNTLKETEASTSKAADSFFEEQSGSETTEESDESKDDDWYGAVKEYYIEKEWNKLPKSLKRREKNRFELHERQVKLGILETPFESEKEFNLFRKASTAKKSRISVKETQKPIYSDNDTSNPDEVEEEPASHTRGSKRASKTQSGTASKKKRRANTKPKRLPGQQLVGSRLLPAFSENSIKSIKSGKPNMNAILADIRVHIEATCGSLYLTKMERDSMSREIVKKYPELADADVQNGFSRLSASISASVRQRRNYIHNIKPRRNAAKSANDVKVICQATEDVHDLNAELKTGSNDRSRTKFLIGKTLELREVEFEAAQKDDDPEIRSKKCQEIWESYPHYKDGKMIIYEHCLHLNLKYEVLEENFNTLTGKLSTLLNMSAETGYEILKIYAEVYEEITPKIFLSPDKKITPPLEVKDVEEAEGPFHIRTAHNAHAPCVLATTTINEQEEEVLSRSYLKLYNCALGTIDSPTPLNVILQILAPYFLGSINYPDAYKSFLRLLEKYVHGTLCVQTATKQKPHVTYTTFVRRLEAIN